MKFTKTKKRWIAFFSAIVMFFITIMPHITKAITIPEEMYNSTYVEPSWNPTKYTADGTGYISSLIPTGLAFNWTTYNKVGNWPFMAQAYLSERPGHLNSEFTDFNNRFIYCVAKYSLQGTTQGRYLTGGVPPVRFSMWYSSCRLWRLWW